MATRPGFYKSGKRNKELARQKKQAEKKQRRLNKAESPEPETIEAAQGTPVSDEETSSPEPNRVTAVSNQDLADPLLVKGFTEN